MENKQHGPFLSKANWTKQNVQKPHENYLKYYSSHLGPNQILFWSNSEWDSKEESLCDLVSWAVLQTLMRF